MRAKQGEFSSYIMDPLTKVEENKKPGERRGGKRRGAGRKRKVDEGAHLTRPEIDGKRHPLHITIRLREGLPDLRQERTLKRLQSFMREARKFGLRVNHFSLLSNHLHMIAEVDNADALKRGMMSFNGRLGRWLRSQGISQGIKEKKYPRGLFKGRYHVQVIKTCRQMKNAMKYVLLNASKHFRKCPYIDRFSSGASFQKWPELLRERFSGLIQEQVWSLQEAREGLANGRESSEESLMAGLAPPATWLGEVGWQRG